MLATIGARVLDVDVAVGHADTQFDDDGHLVDEQLQEQLGEVVAALVGEVAQIPVELAATA